MQLGCLFTLAAMAAGFAASYWDYSLWWTIPAILLAGALLMGSGRSYDVVMRANERGDLRVLPMMWASHSIGPAVAAAVAYGIGVLLK